MLASRHGLVVGNCLLLCAALCSHVASAQPGLRVQTLLTGHAPRMPLLQKKTNDPACATNNKWATEEEVVVAANGGLKNTVVFISRNAPAGKPKDLELTHTACMFRPRVGVVTPDGSLRVVNADATQHHVHLFKGVKTVAHEQQASGADPVVKQLTEHVGSFLRVRCDLHPWEVAFVYVVPNGFAAVTGDNGDAQILELPAGSYTVTAWHERYGQKSAEVNVNADGAGDVKILFDGSEPRP